MRWFLSSIMALTCAFACRAQDLNLATAKARAAFALASLKRDALPPFDSKARAAAGFKSCQEERDFGCLRDLSAAIQRADTEKKPLFILVGMACHDAPEIRAAFPDVVWVHVGTSFNGNRIPRLLVRPVGSTTGIPFLRTDLGDGTPAAIRELLQKTGQSKEKEERSTPMYFRRGRSSGSDC